MTTVKLQFSPADMAAFKTQMKRRVTCLGETKVDALRAGGIALLKSIQVSTKIGRARRKIRVSQSGKRKRVHGNRIFAMETLDTYTGKIRNIILFYPDLETAKMHRGAKIRNRGLAKRSWGWAMQSLFAEYSPSVYTGVRPSDVLRYYVSREDEANNYFEVENRLHYINEALIGGRGGSAVSRAMARAATQMRTRINRAIDEATREAGY